MSSGSQRGGEAKPQSDEAEPPVRGASARSRRALLAVLGLALALRILCAMNRSLWLDEFHSLHHARAADPAGLFSALVQDNHPPLYFLVLRAWVALFGDSELALRAPSVLFGVWTVVLLARLGRKLPGTRASFAAPLLLAVSSLHVIVSAEARMYALLGLVVAGLLLALVEVFEGRRGARARCVVWAVLGLHTHYFFLHSVAVITLACLALAALDAGYRRVVRRLVGPVFIVLFLAAPWYVGGFREQLLHAVQPGANRASPAHLVESVVHLLYYNLALAEPLRVLFLAGGLVALGAWLAGAVVGLRGARGTPAFATTVLAVAAGVGVPVWATAVALLFPRAGFNWTYLAGAAAPFCLLVGAQVRRAHLPLFALGFVVLSAGALSAVNALSSGTEDYRGAVRSMLDEYRAGDGVIAIEPGPAVFPNASGWTYYSRRQRGEDQAPPPLLELTEAYHVSEPSDIRRFERMILLRRSLTPEFATLRLLREHFAEVDTREFGYGLFVQVYSNPPGGD